VRGMVGMGFSFVLDCKLPGWFSVWSDISRKETCILSHSVVITGLLTLILPSHVISSKMRWKRSTIVIGYRKPHKWLSDSAAYRKSGSPQRTWDDYVFFPMLLLQV
jgi:hypothetical protein